jgi:uncharacterized protein YcfJ
MKYLKYILLLSLSSAPTISFSGHLAKDAAIGGGIGGAAGGMIGAEAGGRSGAIIGSAAGAAIGSAILTKDSHDEYTKHPAAPEIYYRSRYKKYKKNKKCPPGLAMQGRC